MINVEIDGKKLEVKEGTSIIEAAEQAGIWIPRFCYHKKLSVAANCRMCLVDVEKAPKPMASCATPVAEGMKVFTTSKKALDAQKIVMEFLLINHPLDCPVCDQGGQCELQDIAMGYGSGASQYQFTKRAIADQDLGPLVATDMTRCILCTRCVRFGKEVAGVRELGMVGRGEHSEITTYVEHTLQHEMAGNIIDLCPVGALTAKPSRFTVRGWEMTQQETVAAHDCIGSNIYAHTLRHKVMRVVPRENEQLNETWISDRDRFSYEGVNSDQRLLQPQLHKHHEWRAVDWQRGLSYAAEGLRAVIEKWGADAVATLASPNCTVEEFYLLRQLMDGIGSPHIDHRLRETDFSDQEFRQLYPALGLSLAEIEKQDAILLIGSRLQQEVPILNHRVRKAALRGTKVMVANQVDYSFNFPVTEKVIASSSMSLVQALAGIAKAVFDKTMLPVSPEAMQLVKSSVSTAAQQAIATQLLSSPQATILLGHLAMQHPHAATLRQLAQLIAASCGAHWGLITEGANAAGAWIAGAVPHRNTANAQVATSGLDYSALLKNPRRAYILVNVDPEFDCANSPTLIAQLQEAEFVVVLTPFFPKGSSLEQFADVLLPMALPMETSGTFVNALGDWQSFKGVAKPCGEARPAWKIVRVLGNLLSLSNFDFNSTEEVIDIVKAKFSEATHSHKEWHCLTPLPLVTGEEPIPAISPYRSDSLVRHAASLQKLLIG